MQNVQYSFIGICGFACNAAKHRNTMAMKMRKCYNSKVNATTITILILNPNPYNHIPTNTNTNFITLTIALFL